MGKGLLGRSVQSVLLAAALMFAATPAWAQFERSSISGTITDSQGGVIPGATVTATNLQTNQTDVAVSDGTGFYNFPTLAPGRYSLSAELQGFKKSTRNNVQADASGSYTIAFRLETGDLTEEVTVTAEASPLQTDVALRKTVEAKDIEQLSFNGRNPIGVAGLKAGVSGGSFNNYGFSSLSNGGFNINGSRSDENNITVDGATAIRTRSSGAVVGIQNVDALQEVQVLTGSYMPEFGRASGGQIRMVTKSGGSRYSGSGSFFFRDDKLQANSWSRNRSSDASQNSGPAPFDYKQYGYAFGGPIPGDLFKDKLFFFGAQEWVNFFRVATNTATVPTALMRQGNFSELLDPSNGFYNGARTILDPLTGQPFPGNIIPANRLSPNGLAMLNGYPAATPGFRQGTANLIQTSPNPQDQRKDNIRFDYRPNSSNQFAYRFSRSNWVAVDAFRGSFDFVRTDWERPNFTQTMSWTSTLKSNLINELTYTFSRDDVFINVFEGGDFQRSKMGINYPYIFAEKEIADKIPTTSITNFSGFDGGPYPAFSSGPIHTVQNTTTLVKGRHTLKGGVQFEYSGEDDFDQINVSAIPGSTNNQNGRFEFLDSRAGGSGIGIANMALGLFNNYAELGQRNFTKWRSAAVDAFVQDSWRPTSKFTVEGGVRYVYWPPWYSTTNNIANFDPRFYNAANAAVINPANGRVISGPRYNGVVLPGDGFLGEAQQSVIANDPQVLALFNGQPRGFSETHGNVFEPRGGVSYAVNEKTVVRVSAGMFHNRVTLNDSTLLGGNPPFQPQATVSNGSVDNPGGAAGGVNAAADLPIGINGQDPVFKHPTSYLWATGVQREIPFGFVVDVTYVGRRGLYLQRERNINQLPLGTLFRPENQGVNIAALRPYTGYGVIRISENSGASIYNSLQVSADRRYTNGLKIGAAYTLSKSTDNASNKRNVLWNTYDDTIYEGASDFDRRHVANFYYIYDLPFWREQDTLVKNLLGGWQISGATFLRSGTPFTVGQNSQDIAGVGDAGFGQPWSETAKASVNHVLYDGTPGTVALDTSVFVRPANGTFGNSPRNEYRNPGEMQWDLALFKNFNLGGTRRAQLRGEMFNFLNHPNLGGIQGNPLSGNFGRITSKGGERDIQLSVRIFF